MIIPSIDLYNGQAVQLQQGKKQIIARDDVFELLETFSVYGEVAIVDLNAAFGEGNNRELIQQMLRKVPCRVGGGIRDLETARFYLKAGASKIILGTSAREDFVKQLPKSQLVFAIDAKGDEWVTHGWTQGANVKVVDVMQELATNCSEFLYTQVEKEGMMQGIDSERVADIVAKSPIPVTVAGGITTLDDIAQISTMGANAQLGMAIYSGKLDLTDAFIAALDFAKQDGLIPTIVQDAQSKDVLMLAYSSRESLQQALAQRKGVYYSRSRKQLWEKGATSGNQQRLVKADFDCDGDTLLFTVAQTGDACHLNRNSCFASEPEKFDLQQLDQILAEKLNQPVKQSFTEKLLANRQLQIEKLQEECAELIETTQFDQVRWEAADLLFFTLAYARANGVGLRDIVCELASRNRAQAKSSGGDCDS